MSKIIKPGEQPKEEISVIKLLMQLKYNLDAVINIVKTQQNEIVKMKEEINKLKESIKDE